MARILFCLLSNLSTKANYFLCKSSLQTAHEPEVGFILSTTAVKTLSSQISEAES